jgi:hypothetical protein
MTRLSAFVDGIGVLGPGLADWPRARAVLRGESAWRHEPVSFAVPTTLPPAERRRVGNAVKVALEVGYAAAAAADRNPQTLATVFTSSGADGANCHELCQMLAGSDRQISPTRFHNSVHNAPAGYWSIATGAMAPSTSLCAYDGSFAAGLLEAACQVGTSGAAVLLVAYDTVYPEPLRSSRPIPDAFGVALLLAPERGPATLAHVECEPGPVGADTMSDPALEALRTTIPTARALPLLQAIAADGSRRVALAYLDGLSLSLAVTR